MSKPNEPPNDSQTAQPQSLKAFIALVLVVASVLIVYGVLVLNSLPDWTERGQFGDMFGAANTLFSGLAFSALVYALVLQREELTLQRKELALTRSELSKQSASQAEQAETALRAAKINALGSLLQSYALLMQSGQHNLIDPANWPDEVLRTKTDLWRMLGRSDA